jgi:amidophosphoribosyltransferase
VKQAPQYCDACFTGDYPTRLTDIAERDAPDLLALPINRVA